MKHATCSTIKTYKEMLLMKSVKPNYHHTILNSDVFREREEEKKNKLFGTHHGREELHPLLRMKQRHRGWDHRG